MLGYLACFLFLTPTVPISHACFWEAIECIHTPSFGFASIPADLCFHRWVTTYDYHMTGGITIHSPAMTLGTIRVHGFWLMATWVCFSPMISKGPKGGLVLRCSSHCLQMVLVALATVGQPFPGTLVPSGKQMENRLWDNDVVLWCIMMYYVFSSQNWVLLLPSIEITRLWSWNDRSYIYIYIPHHFFVISYPHFTGGYIPIQTIQFLVGNGTSVPYQYRSNT